MQKFTKVSVDIETVGTSPGCAIVSIGACVFGPEGIGAEFYVEIDWRASGLAVDSETMEWWGKQSDAVREALDSSDPQPIGQALGWLADFLRRYEVEEIWAKGASFDFAILGWTYKHFQMDVPWDYRKERCLRTLRGLGPLKKYTVEPREGDRFSVLHNALGDARVQAIEIMFRQLPPRLCVDCERRLPPLMSIDCATGAISPVIMSSPADCSTLAVP